MALITLRFACGHTTTVTATATSAPLCVVCGESRVQSVQTPPPRFTGACRGPYAETTAVEPGIVNVAPAGPLRLKEQP